MRRFPPNSSLLSPPTRHAVIGVSWNELTCYSIHYGRAAHAGRIKKQNKKKKKSAAIIQPSTRRSRSNQKTLRPWTGSSRRRVGQRYRMFWKVVVTCMTYRVNYRAQFALWVVGFFFLPPNQPRTDNKKLRVQSNGVIFVVFRHLGVALVTGSGCLTTRDSFFGAHSRSKNSSALRQRLFYCDCPAVARQGNAVLLAGIFQRCLTWLGFSSTPVEMGKGPKKTKSKRSPSPCERLYKVSALTLPLSFCVLSMSRTINQCISEWNSAQSKWASAEFCKRITEMRWTTLQVNGWNVACNWKAAVVFIICWCCFKPT